MRAWPDAAPAWPVRLPGNVAVAYHIVEWAPEAGLESLTLNPWTLAFAHRRHELDAGGEVPPPR